MLNYLVFFFENLAQFVKEIIMLENMQSLKYNARKYAKYFS